MLMVGDVIALLIVALVAGMAAWFGAARAAARSWAALGFGLIMLLAAAGICWIIAEGKTGGFLAGIVGAVFTLLSLIAAGAVVAGAALRLIHEWRYPPAGDRPASTGWLGVLGVGLYSGLAVLLSALE